MTQNDANSDADDLIRRAANGEQPALDELFSRHRQRLKQMIALRMDERLKARFDPSDVVQTALIKASARLSEYAREPQFPFYPWLRNLAWQELLRFHEQHMQRQKRTIHREEHTGVVLSSQSVHQLAELVAASTAGPSTAVVLHEQRQRTREALEELPFRDREILELRYLEQLDNAEIAAVLDIDIGTVRVRHFRALRRLESLLSTDADLNQL